MIKSITVTNHLGESLKMELSRPELSGFLITSGTSGFGPTKANINMTDMATLDGSRFNSARQDRRDVVLKMEFLDSDEETIEDIRHKSYRFFPPKQNIHIVVETDNRSVETNGYVANNEPDIFSKKEGCAVTISCEDSYLYSLLENETIFSGVKAAFSFPFANRSTSKPLLKMGSILNKTEELIRYEGDPEIGVIINIHAVGTATNVIIRNVTARKKMRIDTTRLSALTGSTIIAGDTIIIDTHDTRRSITLIRDGVETNILNCLDRGTDWLTLKKGDNIFAYEAESGASNLQFYITNKIAYLGV